MWRQPLILVQSRTLPSQSNETELLCTETLRCKGKLMLCTCDEGTKPPSASGTQGAKWELMQKAA